MTKKIISIDQGTSSSRAILFDENLSFLSSEQEEFEQFFPKNGWVEHNPLDLLGSVLSVTKKLFLSNNLRPSDVASIGITNQRETTLVWDRGSGKAIYPAIVWQDRRTFSLCEELRSANLDAEIQSKTGLLLDPYFSATKLSWILDHVPGARRRAEKGELAFGTVDSFLLWHLTGGKVHKTDITNAARTMLFNLETNKWDQDLLNLFNIPMNILPEVCDNAHQFGETSLFGGSISIGGMAGDQQSALIGQCCFQEGEAKSTFGTGCFVLVNTGSKMVKSKNKLLSTVAYRLNGKTTFGLEGSIFIAGSAIQWLRDELKFFNNAQEVETVIKKASDTSNVMVIPAFTGLGAPFWDPEARGLIYGLTRDSGIPEITLATLQSVIYQTRSLLDAMKLDGAPISKLKVDGGMVINSWLNQELSNCLRLKVLVPKMVETTSLGAAYLAGLSAEIFPDLESLSSSWKLDKQYDFDQKLSERSNTNYERWLRVLNKLSL
ncbi:MAG: glycerol kinase GlpK [SAR86 cluster bacterium]|nr:glycerol kinase GlpK [SAR86 cluster bacterium]